MGLYDGTLVGSPTFTSTGVPSAFGQAIVLDGSSQYVQIPTIPISMNAANGASWTQTCRIKTGITQLGIIFGCYNAGSPAFIGWQIEENNTQEYSSVNLTTLGPATPVINDNSWHHLEMGYDGLKAYLFLDGIIVNAGGTSVTWTQASSGTSAAQIGAHRLGTGGSPNLFFGGQIDEVATFNICLHTSNFTPPTAPYTGSETGLVTVWHLDGDVTSSDPSAPTILNTLPIISTSGMTGIATDNISRLSVLPNLSISNISGSISDIVTIILQPVHIFSTLSQHITLLPQTIYSTSNINTSNPIRFTQIYGYIYNSSLVPREGVSVQVIATITGSDIETFDKITISGRPLSVKTDGTGLWTLDLLSPVDVAHNSFIGATSIDYSIVLDATGPEPITIPLVSFAYSSTPINIADIVDTTEVIPIVPMIGYCGNENGGPISGATITAILSGNATYAPNNNITIGAGQILATKTDSNGFYFLPLIPNSQLIPSTRYYTITEDSSTTKNIFVPDGGGYVWNSVVALVSSAATGIILDTVAADLLEENSFSIPVKGNSITTNLDNIRSIISTAFGEPWSTVVEEIDDPIIVNPNAVQNGAVQISNSIQSFYTTSKHMGSTVNNIQAIIHAHAGTGATINSSTNGNIKHGFISLTTGTTNWCPGVVVTVTFKRTTIINYSRATIQLMPGNNEGYEQLVNCPAYVEFTSTGFTISFTETPTRQFNFDIFYSIEGIIATILPPVVPAAPTLVSAVASTNQVTLTWSAGDDGGSPITSYTVIENTLGIVYTGNTLTTIITGLNNGTSYTFSVIATNSVGNSLSSNSLSATPIYPSSWTGSSCTTDNELVCLTSFVVTPSSSLPHGNTATFTVTVNTDVGPTVWYISVYNEANVHIGTSSGGGTTNVVTVFQASPTTHTYRGVLSGSNTTITSDAVFTGPLTVTWT